MQAGFPSVYNVADGFEGSRVSGRLEGAEPALAAGLTTATGCLSRRSGL